MTVVWGVNQITFRIQIDKNLLMAGRNAIVLMFSDAMKSDFHFNHETNRFSTWFCPFNPTNSEQIEHYYNNIMVML